ncbi:ubiquitinyl hydrolase 1 [Ranunculus cassubicifolius]
MSVSDLYFDPYTLLQFVFTAIVIAIGFLQLVKNTASNYFFVEANFDDQDEQQQHNNDQNQNMCAVAANCSDGCAVCGDKGIKQCSGCKSVRYCSTLCQSKHWKEGHKQKCQELKLSGRLLRCDNESKNKLKKVLFPYEDFVKLFRWEEQGSPPCGLLNIGNSCYANVVLQCLSCTRPLIAYLLEIGHARKCKRNDWCFLCELESHVKRTRDSRGPFSPINILSRLPHIGGNLGYGKQEDAHEFMRFAIDTMQSVCLDEFGGEKALHPISQETTLIQYIFAGHLKSQVKCLKCNKISYRHEKMLDLTVEIHGDAESLEECMDQFTAEESLDGENMYKCDGCNDYVRACKRLAIHHAPNILTITLKRFQTGRFGKLNKRVTFPETLDLGPYMSEAGPGTDVYQLYAVVVHIDMLNASYFGHYICYTKDFHGNWYRIDDCKVTNVELEEVLAQGAYMLLYSRIFVGPSFVKPEDLYEEKELVAEEAQPCVQSTVDAVTAVSDISIASAPTTENQQEGSLDIDQIIAKPQEICIEETENVVEEARTMVEKPVASMPAADVDEGVQPVVDSITVERSVASRPAADVDEGIQPFMRKIEPSSTEDYDSSVCTSLLKDLATQITWSQSSLDMDIDDLIMPPQSDELNNHTESSSSAMEVDESELPSSSSNERLHCQSDDIPQLPETSTSQVAKSKSDTNSKQRPATLFSSGFLIDKRARRDSLNKNGNITALGKVDHNGVFYSNGHQNGVDHEISCSDTEMMDSDGSNGKSCSSRHMNDSTDELPHKGNNSCNGSGKLFNPNRFTKSHNDDDENISDQSAQSHCNDSNKDSCKEENFNRSHGHKKLGAKGIDAAFSPGFLNKPSLPRKKKEENGGPSSNGIVSPNKLQRVG